MSPVARAACSLMAVCWRDALSTVSAPNAGGCADPNGAGLRTELLAVGLEGGDWAGMVDQARRDSPLWSRRATYAPACLVLPLLRFDDGGGTLLAFVRRVRRWLCARQLEAPGDVVGRVQALRTAAAIVEHVAIAALLLAGDGASQGGAAGGEPLAPLMRDALYFSEELNEVRVHFWLLRLHRSMVDRPGGGELVDTSRWGREVDGLRLELVADGTLRSTEAD